MRFLSLVLICLTAWNADCLEVIILGGQSNSIGQGAHLQHYSGPDEIFTRAYTIKGLADPVCSNSGTLDPVYNGPSGGSVWPETATVLDAQIGKQFMFVPCNSDGTSITLFQPAGPDPEDRTNKATLYGALMWRLYQARTNGEVRCVHMIEGETDAHNGMKQQVFQSNICYFADQIYADAGVPTVFCTLYTNAVPTAQEDAINAAIRASWGTHHILPGADLNVIEADTPPHVTTDAGLTWSGGLIATNLMQNFYDIQFIPTNEVDGTFSASSYDTAPHDWGNTFACYYYCMYPQFTNHIYSWSRSGSSSELDYEAQEEKYCLPFWASFPVPGNDWYLFNDNGSYRSNDVVQWGTNIFAGPPVFWNGTAQTNEGVATAGITHYAMGCIPHDSADGDSGAISRNDGSMSLDRLYGTPIVDMWHLLWMNGVSTDQGGARLFGFDPGGHPWQAGFLCMTLQSLIALHAETNCGAMTFDWATATVSTNHCVVSNTSVSDSMLTATVHFDRMPLGWDVPDGTITNDARPAFVVMPFLANHFTWILQVTNLPAGNYTVAIDGSNVVSLSSSQLAIGWNMFTNYNGALWAQRKEVLGRKRDQEGLDRVTLLAHGGGFLGALNTGDLVNYQGWANLEYVSNGKRGSDYVSSMATLIADMQVYDDAIQAAAVQTNHVFTIIKTAPRFAPFYRRISGSSK